MPSVRWFGEPSWLGFAIAQCFAVRTTSFAMSVAVQSASVPSVPTQTRPPIALNSALEASTPLMMSEPLVSADGSGDRAAGSDGEEKSGTEETERRTHQRSTSDESLHSGGSPTCQAVTLLRRAFYLDEKDPLRAVGAAAPMHVVSRGYAIEPRACAGSDLSRRPDRGDRPHRCRRVRAPIRSPQPERGDRCARAASPHERPRSFGRRALAPRAFARGARRGVCGRTGAPGSRSRRRRDGPARRCVAGTSANYP